MQFIDEIFKELTSKHHYQQILHTNNVRWNISDETRHLASFDTKFVHANNTPIAVDTRFQRSLPDMPTVIEWDFTGSHHINYRHLSQQITISKTKHIIDNVEAAVANHMDIFRDKKYIFMGMGDSHDKLYRTMGKRLMGKSDGLYRYTPSSNLYNSYHVVERNW